MKRVLPSALVGWFLNYARTLEHPQLFKWISVIFLVDLLIPDLVPFVDEILLGLAALFLGRWKKSHPEKKPTVKTAGGKSSQSGSHRD